MQGAQLVMLSVMSVPTIRDYNASIMDRKYSLAIMRCHFVLQVKDQRNLDIAYSTSTSKMTSSKERRRVSIANQVLPKLQEGPKSKGRYQQHESGWQSHSKLGNNIH